MTTDQEMRVLRKQTHGYIRANPSSVVFTRYTREDDGAGGTRKTAPNALAPQVVRIIQAQEAKTVERVNADGTVVRPTLNVMAEYNANIEKGDTFTWDGRKAEVVYVQDMGYELIAEVSV